MEVAGADVQHGLAAPLALLVQAVHSPGIGGQHAGGKLRVGIAYLVIWAVQLFFGRIFAVRVILETLSVLIAAAVLFRTFSRNLSKRRAENARFLNWCRPIRDRLSGARQRRLDKAHKYFTCKNCKAICRVPAGKGKIEITCPKCGGKIIGKS